MSSWNALISHLQANLPEQTYNTWFKPLTFNSFEGGVLRLGVPTSFVANYIESHFRPILAEAIQKSFGAGVRLEYVILPAAQEQEQASAQTSDATASAAPSTPLPPLQHGLNPHYTFDTFVAGAANKLARSVALSIVKQPGKSSFNPFFLYGASGVGKTHLANAIGVKILENRPDARVLFVSAHIFRSQFVEANLKNTTPSFLAFYQSVDVLIIDDIQEFTTAKTQLAFFHVFNHLQQLGRQIILTCDRPPSQLPGIEERMLTRFLWGMVAEIEKPDIKLRRDILASKVRRDGLEIPRNVIQYVATHVESSVRELEGIVNQLMAYSVVDDCDINLALAERIVQRATNIERKSLTPDEILRATCRHYGVKPREVQGKGRSAPLSLPRQVSMFLIQKYTNESYAQIGVHFSNRDHSTVLYACRTISRRLASDRDFRHEIEELEHTLRA